MKNTAWTVKTTIGLLAFSAAAQGATVEVDSTPGVNFANYKTYSWRVHPVFEKRPALAEEYSVGIELVKNAANQILMARGFQPSQHDADFYVTFMLTGKMKQDVDVEIDSGMYGWGGWYSWPSMYYPTWTKTVVTNYVEGVLVLDIVDAKANQLVWRAYCKDDVREWKNRDKNVQKVVSKALKQFPPKK